MHYAVIYIDECARDVAFRPEHTVLSALQSNRLQQRCFALASPCGAPHGRCSPPVWPPPPTRCDSRVSSCSFDTPSLLASLLPQDAALPPRVFLDPPVQGSQVCCCARTPLVLRLHLRFSTNTLPDGRSLHEASHAASHPAGLFSHEHDTRGALPPSRAVASPQRCVAREADPPVERLLNALVLPLSPFPSLRPATAQVSGTATALIQPTRRRWSSSWAAPARGKGRSVPSW